MLIFLNIEQNRCFIESVTSKFRYRYIYFYIGLKTVNSIQKLWHRIYVNVFCSYVSIFNSIRHDRCQEKTSLFYLFYEMADQLNVTKRDQRKLAIFFHPNCWNHRKNMKEIFLALLIWTLYIHCYYIIRVDGVRRKILKGRFQIGKCPAHF